MKATEGFMENFTQSRALRQRQEALDMQERENSLNAFNKLYDLYGPDLYKDTEAVALYEKAMHPLRFPRDANGNVAVPQDWDRKKKQFEAEYFGDIRKRAEETRRTQGPGYVSPEETAVLGGVTPPESLSLATAPPEAQDIMRKYITGQIPNESVRAQLMETYMKNFPKEDPRKIAQYVDKMLKRPEEVTRPTAPTAAGAVVGVGAPKLTPTPMPSSTLISNKPEDATSRVLAEPEAGLPVTPEAPPTEAPVTTTPTEPVLPKEQAPTLNLRPMKPNETPDEYKAYTTGEIEKYKAAVGAPDIATRAKEAETHAKKTEADVKNIDSLVAERLKEGDRKDLDRIMALRKYPDDKEATAAGLGLLKEWLEKQDPPFVLDETGLRKYWSERVPEWLKLGGVEAVSGTPGPVGDQVIDSERPVGASGKPGTNPAVDAAKRLMEFLKE